VRPSSALLSFVLFAQAVSAAEVLRVTIDGVVHPVTVEILRDAINQARNQRAEALLVRLDTPGGLLEATRESVQLLLSSPVPVITFVAPGGARAASAGFFLLLAGDVAAMAPGTRTGAASPVLMSGSGMDPVMRKKVQNDTAAWIRTIASRRGRNAEAAQQTVNDAKSFTDDEALAANLINLVAATESDLLAQVSKSPVKRFDGTQETLAVADSAVTDYRPTLRQRVMQSVSNPNLAFVLMVLGALGLYIEFTSPGFLLPGVAGAILLLIGLAGLSVLPISWLGVALILLALGLFVAEAFITSHGVLGVGGAVALVFGAMLLVKGPPEMRIGLSTALGVAVPFALIAVFLASLVVKSHRQKVTTGDSGMVGAVGVTRTALSPSGTIFVHGEYWEATSSVPIPENTRVRVVAVNGLHLQVEPEGGAEKEILHGV
jgi:membrane-bound serine protease (ClpP class)